MFPYIHLRIMCKTEKCLSRLIQTLSVSDKTVPDSSLQLEKYESGIQNVQTKTALGDPKPYVYTKTVSSMLINKSEILQELLKFNVELYKIEKNAEAFDYILQRNFADIKEHIIFLKELDLEDSDIGQLITKNPLILREDLEDLRVRINYLKYKRFSDEMITSILKKNPFWLSHSAAKIDECLGSVQKLLQLETKEVRLLATIYSKLITYPLDKLKFNVFVFKEEMGFEADEMKQMILKLPKLLLHGREKTLKTFLYVHQSMDIPHNRIVQECQVLSCRESRLKPRHLFLVKLGRAQYDPKMPNYISLTTLITGTDSFFSTEVAKSSVKAYNIFLKSL